MALSTSRTLITKTGISTTQVFDMGGINISGGDFNLGSAIKLGNASGIITATTFSGSLAASNLTGALPAISGANLTSLPTQVTLSSNADNRIITGGSGTNLVGEQNLTFDGTILTLTKSSTTAYNTAATTNDSAVNFINSGAAGHATLQFQSVSGGSANTGQATISAFNESSGSKNTALTFGTRQNSDATVRERLRIKSNGDVLIGTSDSTTVGTVNKNLIVGSTTNNDEVGLTLNVMEGVHGRRVKFFLDDNDGVFGVDSTASTGVAPFVVRMSSSEKLRIDSNGHVLPGANNAQDLGSTAKGWRNVYMNDLNLSNMKGDTNDVDGTQGSWTIQEGKDDLYIINRLNGKKFKIKMEEIS